MGLAFPKLSLTVIVVIIILVCLIFGSIMIMRGKNPVVDNLSEGNKILRIVSIILNFIWTILFIPMIPVSIMAGAATVMMTDSGNLSSFQTDVIILCMLLFWAIPVVTIVGVVLSFFLRKSSKYLMSVILQIIPVFICLISVGILFFTFWAH